MRAQQPLAHWRAVELGDARKGMRRRLIKCYSSGHRPVSHAMSRLNAPTTASLNRAFTLLELLVAAAILGVLAALLLPVLGRARDKGRQTQCLNNLRQQAMALVMYLPENGDVFPAPGSALYGHHPEDWLWWQVGLDANQSAIARYVGSGVFMTNLYQCPADREARTTDTSLTAYTNFCRFSYSLTSYERTNGLSPGLATLITSGGRAYRFRSASVNNPAGKILLLEEERAKINDARWVPGISTVTTRHYQRGNAAFGDGHVAAVEPRFASDVRNSLPSH